MNDRELGYLNREHTEDEWLEAQEGVDALMRVVRAARHLVNVRGTARSSTVAREAWDRLREALDALDK